MTNYELAARENRRLEAELAAEREKREKAEALASFGHQSIQYQCEITAALLEARAKLAEAERDTVRLEWYLSQRLHILIRDRADVDERMRWEAAEAATTAGEKEGGHHAE